LLPWLAPSRAGYSEDELQSDLTTTIVHSYYIAEKRRYCNQVIVAIQNVG